MFILITTIFYLNSASVATTRFPNQHTCELARNVTKREVTLQVGGKGTVRVICRIIN